jgi:hypothetical protein
MGPQISVRRLPRQKLAMRWQGHWQLSCLMTLGATLGGEMGMFTLRRAAE